MTANGQGGSGRVVPSAHRKQAATTRASDPLWDVLDDELGKVETASERGRRNRALKELRDIGVTPDELRRRIRTYRRKFPNIVVTPTALTANWSLLAAPRPPQHTPVAAVVDLPPADVEANLARIRELQARLLKEV